MYTLNELLNIESESLHHNRTIQFLQEHKHVRKENYKFVCKYFDFRTTVGNRLQHN